MAASVDPTPSPDLVTFPVKGARSMMSKRRCTYCPNDATTSDHVPPECFFARPLPNDLITVPACESCNHAFGEDDGFVRNILVSLADAERHPDVVRDLQGRMRRALAGDQKLLKRTLLTLTPVDVRTEAGLFLGKAAGIKLDQPQFDRFFKRLARALLFRCTGIGLLECLVEWRPVVGTKLSELQKQFAEIPPACAGTVGERVFDFAGFINDPERDLSLWVLQFYAGPIFMMLLHPAILVGTT
jgi:hypothetical protein